jgi:O-antigen/teichoic acid export membrane protein
MQAILRALSKSRRMLLSYSASGASLLVSAGAQLVTLAVLARFLGVEQFGFYAAITALTAVGVQIVGLGANESLVRRVAQDPSLFPTMLGHSLLLSLSTGAVLTGIGCVIIPWFLPVSDTPWQTLVATGLILTTQFILYKTIFLAGQSYIAHSRFGTANVLEIVFAVVRTGAAVLGCMLFGVSNVYEWAFWQFGAHIVVCVLAVVLIGRLGWPTWRIVRDEIKLGILFSTQFVFKAIRSNVDLVVLSAVAGAEIVGSYSIARRMLENSYMSIEALNRLIYPGAAARSVGGIHNNLQRTMRVFGATMGIAFTSALMVFLLSPILPLLFGEQYVSLVGFTRTVCWIVLPMAIYGTALEALGAARLQGARAAIWNTGNLLGALLAAAATYQFAIAGTFVANFVVEIAIAIAAWVVLLAYVKRHRHDAATAADRAAGVAPALG